MAVIANQNQNDQQNQQQKGQNSLNPLQTVGTAAPSGQGPAGSPQAQQQSSNLAQQQQSGSGRFTNLQKYLQANQGGSQRIASNIENQYNKQANAVRQGIEQAQGTLNNQVNPLQQQLGDQGAQQIQQGFTDPNAVLNDQDSLTNFRNLAGGLGQNISNIAGTQNLQQQQLQGQVGNLQNTANLAGTEQGRFQLLRNSVNAPDYSQGAQRLDQTLLQSQPSVTNNLQAGLQGIANQTGQQLSGLSQDTIAKINALKGLSQNRQEQWQNLLNNGVDNAATAGEGQLNQQGVNDISQAVQNQYAALQQSLPQQQAALQNAFTGNQFTPEQLKALGLQAGMNTYGLSGADLMKAGNFQFNPNLSAYANGGANQAANQEQLNRYNALRQLAGMDQNASIFSGDQTGYNPLTYDTQALNKALEAKKTALNQDLFNQAQNAYNSINSTASTAGTGTIWSDYTPFYRAMSAIKAELNKDPGNMNADAIAAAIERLKTEGQGTQLNSSGGGFHSAGGYGRYNLSGAVANALNNIYSTYNPAMASRLNQTSPDDTQHQLPTKSDGSIDWGAIKAPQGK